MTRKIVLIAACFLGLAGVALAASYTLDLVPGDQAIVSCSESLLVTQTVSQTVNLCVTSSPTSTPVPTYTDTPAPSFTPTDTDTPPPTNTATATDTPPPTDTPTATDTPTPTSVPTDTPTNTALPTATNTPSNTATPTPLPDLIFADGFESGNLSAWTSSVTDTGSLSVSAAAALAGARGLQALINDNNAIYVADGRPSAEPRYRARFYFDPNTIAMSSGNTHDLFVGRSGGLDMFRVQFRYSGGTYQALAQLRSDATSYSSTSWYTISDAPHFIEIDWRASTAAGANNGYLSLWIDNTLRQTVSNIDNDTRRVDDVLLGPLSGIDTGTRGTYYLDAFESRRVTFIGPEPSGPTPTPTSTPTPADTPTPTLPPTATPTASDTPTPTPTVPSPTPTPSPTPAATAFFSLFAGLSDVSPHQIVRTNADRLYVFTPQVYSTVIRAYWADGLPVSAANFSGPAQVAEADYVVTVDAVYDGSTTIYVLALTRNGTVRRYAFDTTTNSFGAGQTLATNAATVTGDYAGSEGVVGAYAGGALHVVYWSNANHIIYYNTSTQLDSGSSAQHPAIAVAPNGSLTVAWIQTDKSVRVRTLSGGVWGAVEQVNTANAYTSTSGGISIDQGPSLLIDSAGVRHLTYIEDWRAAAPYDYGRVHYVTNGSGAWIDQYVGVYSHNPALALSSAGQLRLIAHGYALNATCTDNADMCYMVRSGSTWSAFQLFAANPAGASFDSSPSGNLPGGPIEFLFLDEIARVLYYGRME